MSDPQTKNVADTARDPARALLHEAINASNLDRVRDILREICARSTQAFDLACERLLAEIGGDTSGSESHGSEDEGEEDNEDDESEEDEQPRTSPEDKKRKALTLQFEICEQCEEEYDVEDNFEEACMWHPGELEVKCELEAWVGHEDRYHGPLDTAGNRRENPDAFVYSCCGKTVKWDGCEMGEHSPGERKRRRY